MNTLTKQIKATILTVGIACGILLGSTQPSAAIPAAPANAFYPYYNNYYNYYQNYWSNYNTTHNFQSYKYAVAFYYYYLSGLYGDEYAYYYDPYGGYSDKHIQNYYYSSSTYHDVYYNYYAYVADSWF